MIRFSLASVLLLVMFAGLGCAAMVNANDLWRQSMVTATVAVLLIATLAATVKQGRSRAFSTGFAVSGWIYLLLVFVPALGLRDDLLTDKAVTWLFATIHGDELVQMGNVVELGFAPQGRVLLTGSQINTVRVWDASTGRAIGSGAVDNQDFADIGHSLWVVIVACLGGIIARSLASVKNREQASERHANAAVGHDE